MALDDLYNALPPPALGPQDLGVSPLGPAPTPPQTQHPDMLRRILPLIAAAIAAKAGPGAGTGIASGVLHATAADAQQRHQQQQVDEQTYRYQQQTYAQQQREYEADVNRRQQLVQTNIQALRQKALEGGFETQDQLNNYARVFAQGLQSQGVRGVTPEFLIKAVPFYAKSEQEQLTKALDKVFETADKHNTPIDPAASIQITQKDGTLRRVSVIDAVRTSNYPATVDAFNQTLKKVADHPLTPNEAAGKAGVYADELAKLKAVPGAVENEEMRAKARKAADAWEVQQAGAVSAARRGPEKPTGSESSAIQPDTPAYRTAQDIAYGKLTFPQIRTLLAYNRDSKFKLNLYDKARELNPAFDPAAFEAGYKFATNPQVTQRLIAIDALSPVIDKAIELSDQVPRGNVQTFNRLLMGARLQISNRKVASLDQLATLLGDEAGLALGTGSGSDLKTRLGISMVNQNLGTEAFRDTLNQLRDVLQARKTTIIQQMGPYGRLRDGTPDDASVEQWGFDANGNLVRKAQP